MVILGIDPGSQATGYGIITKENAAIKLLETGTVKPRSTETLHHRINTVYSNVKAIIEQFRPDILVLEKLYAHYKHPATASTIAHVRGVICLLCAQENISLAEHSVKRIRKAVTGNGNATKLQTRRMVAHLLNINENKLTLDASDALALALGHAQMHRLI